MDTPETTHPTRGVEPYGPEASAYTTARLTGATVRLDRDPAGDDQNAYGRLLRYVMLPSGENFNATLLQHGLATAIRTFPYSRQAEFLQLEAQARAEGYGPADDHGRTQRRAEPGARRVTIDMLRHASIRAILTHAASIDPEPIRIVGVKRWIDLTRRAVLPAGITPDRAADLMEATAGGGRELKRRAGIKGWQFRVRKPVFALTLYWDGEPPAEIITEIDGDDSGMPRRASGRRSRGPLVRGGPRNWDSLLRWDPDQGEGVWNATEETELSC